MTTININNNQNFILPIDFINRMKNMLGNDYDEFIASFDEQSVKAFHINTKRISPKKIEELYHNKNIEKISYYDNGCFDFLDEKIGYNPLNHAGAIYSQDPAAMMPVATLKEYIKGSEKILDLCSAPGGKASQLAMLLDDENGFLVSNEINPARNKILCSNIERMGYKNVLVTKLEPSELAEFYDSYFDIVVVDAPCSGEGMFRKYPESINEWSLENVKLCQERQKDILKSAYKCLNPGGYLLYSTCTYSYEEDEEIVNWLIDNYSLTPIMPNEDIIKSTYSCEIKEARKFYPHIAKGEGQFLCLLRKETSNSTAISISKPVNLGQITKLSNQEIKALSNELDFISIDYDKLYKFNEKIIYISNPNVNVCYKGVTSAFLTIGTLDNNKDFSSDNRKNNHKEKFKNVKSKGPITFTPSHSLFHSLGDFINNKVNFEINNINISKYLHGEEILLETVSKGYGVITVEGIPIGGFKASNGRLKNHYPKGLRNNN